MSERSGRIVGRDVMIGTMSESVVGIVSHS